MERGCQGCSADTYPPNHTPQKRMKGPFLSYYVWLWHNSNPGICFAVANVLWWRLPSGPASICRNAASQLINRSIVYAMVAQYCHITPEPRWLCNQGIHFQHPLHIFIIFSSYKVTCYSSIKCCINHLVENSIETKRELSLITTFLKANLYMMVSYQVCHQVCVKGVSVPGRALWDVSGGIKPPESRGPVTLLTALTALARTKWSSGGICPSLQKSLQAWEVKELTTACRTRPQKGWCARFSSSEWPAGRSSGSAQMHQYAFGTSHQRYLRAPGPHCSWRRNAVFQSSRAIQ